MNAIHTLCTLDTRREGVCRDVAWTRRTPVRHRTGGSAATLVAGVAGAAAAASGTATASPATHSTAAAGLLIFVIHMRPPSMAWTVRRTGPARRCAS
ncbi:hypothetical protein AB0F15_37065 [Amycolatopsis sp. NPDC026612]|uniref:hypothetical protein n=1 Tax=Amycolatopsis sp. NPDC026612 TaxID=3155466 RepID=UPI0033F34673